MEKTCGPDYVYGQAYECWAASRRAHTIRTLPDPTEWNMGRSWILLSSMPG